MAIASYLCRVIYKEHTTDGDFTGTYKLLVKSKSIPTPVGTPNEVETTTFEDGAHTFIPGIKTSDSLEITGNLEKEYLDAIDDLDGQNLDIMQLYGKQGIGEEAKYAYTGYAYAAPSDVSGIDEVVEMTVKVIKDTVPEKVTDDYTITDNGDGTFTVAAAA